MAHLLMALITQKEQTGHAVCGSTALALVIPLTTCAAQTAHAVITTLQSSANSCPSEHHGGYLCLAHYASSKEPSQLIPDLQGHPAKSGNEHGATFQLEILTGFAVWCPPLLLGQAPVA